MYRVPWVVATSLGGAELAYPSAAILEVESLRRLRPSASSWVLLQPSQEFDERRFGENPFDAALGGNIDFGDDIFTWCITM